MPALETLKKITETATGWARPPSDDLDRLVRARHYRSQWRGADATSIHSSRLSSPVMAASRICAAPWPSTFPFTVALRRLVPYA
jgi:hypothetical protein